MKYILSFLFLICLQSGKAQLHKDTTGNINSAFGRIAFLRSDNPNFRNSIAVGNAEGQYKNTIGTYTTAFGYLTLKDTNINNTAIGGDSYITPCPYNNTEVGYYSLSEWYSIGDYANLHGNADTLFIEDTSIHFIRIDGQTFEIKRNVTLEPVQKNKSWISTTPSGLIIGGSGTPSSIQLSHK